MYIYISHTVSVYIAACSYILTECTASATTARTTQEFLRIPLKGKVNNNVNSKR